MYQCNECGSTASTRADVPHPVGCHGARFAGYIVPVTSTPVLAFALTTL